MGSNGRLRAIAPVGKQWPKGTVLTVAFMGGTEQQRSFVRSIIPQWETKCGIRFEFKPSLPAMIRIGFDSGDGAWSYVGTDCASIPTNQATTNLGWLDQAVVLHEIGHALSFLHEHQNPSGGLQWDREAVIADLSGAPNYWSVAEIEHNVLNKYSVDQILGTDFDSKSIMLYSFPASWTTNGFSAPWNTSISVQDAAFANRLYPLATDPPVVRPKIPVRVPVLATLSQARAVNEYDLVIETRGVYIVETGGGLDLVLAVYRDSTLLGQDDDAGRGRNSRLELMLDPGTYRATVRHYSTGTGKYGVMCWRVE